MSAPLQAMGGLTTEQVMGDAGRMQLEVITPEDASDMLGALYARQRSRNNTAKSVYLQSMREGHWRVSNDAICISRDGELLNGQHRLMAVVENGEPIVAWVWRGASPDIYDILDNSYARSAYQVLDCPNRRDVCALAKAIISIEDGCPLAAALASTNTMPRWQITERVESDMDNLQMLVRTSINIKSRTVGGPRTAFGVALYTFGAVVGGFNPEQAVAWLEEADVTTLSLTRTIQKKTATEGKVPPGWACAALLLFLEAKMQGKERRQYGRVDETLERFTRAYREAVMP